MKIVTLLRLTIAQSLVDWALSEIDPLHPDLPGLVVRRRALVEKVRRLGI